MTTSTARSLDDPRAQQDATPGSGAPGLAVVPASAALARLIAEVEGDGACVTGYNRTYHRHNR